jgi:transposase
MVLERMMDLQIMVISGIIGLNTGKNEFVNGLSHINGIENFWGLCKVRLAKFRGIHKHTFYLHIKECEFRDTYRDKYKKKMYLTLLKNIRNNPLI